MPNYQYIGFTFKSNRILMKKSLNTFREIHFGVCGIPVYIIHMYLTSERLMKTAHLLKNSKMMVMPLNVNTDSATLLDVWWLLTAPCTEA